MRPGALRRGGPTLLAVVAPASRRLLLRAPLRHPEATSSEGSAFAVTLCFPLRLSLAFGRPPPIPSGESAAKKWVKDLVKYLT